MKANVPPSRPAPRPERDFPGPSPEHRARQWRRLLVLRVAAVLVAVALGAALIEDRDARSLLVLILGGIYLPLSLALHLSQPENPKPPSWPWMSMVVMDVGVVTAVQALIPSLAAGLLALFPIVVVNAQLFGIRWGTVVALVGWAGVAAATLFGRPGQLGVFPTLMVGPLLVAVAFVVGRLAADERRAADRVRRLARAAAALGSSMDASEILETLCREARQAMGATFAVVLVLEGGELRFGAGSGHPPGFPSLSAFLSERLHDPGALEAPTPKAVRTVRPAVVRDTETDEGMAPWRDLARGLGFRSTVAVPVARGDQVTGVLSVYLPRPHTYTDEELDFLSALGESAAVAIDRAAVFAREKEAAERLRELDRMKSEFVATVSHELRTPLTAILGFTQTLRSRWRELSAEVRDEFLDRVGENARSLEHLITHLLDFSRLERGQFRIEARPHDVGGLVEAVLENMVHELSEHVVRTDVPGELRVMTDPYAFDRMLGNLLSNAAKFSPPGTAIDVAAAASGTMVRLSVRDRGPGIPGDALERIFDRFYRGASSAPGAGIGLAVVRELAELHGGRVVAANADPGAVFTLSLPRAGDEEAEAEPGSAPVSAARGR